MHLNFCDYFSPTYTLTAVPEKDENVGIFFGVDSIVTKLRIGLFFTTVQRSCPIATKTHSNSARTSPDDNNDDTYASDH